MRGLAVTESLYHRATKLLHCRFSATGGTRSFSSTKTTSSEHRQSHKRGKTFRGDEYAKKQFEARKAANMRRQEVLQRERAAAEGDFIFGTKEQTPFIKSLRASSRSDESPVSHSDTHNSTILAHFLDTEELNQAMIASGRLSAPIVRTDRTGADPSAERSSRGLHARQHENAVTAIQRIVNANEMSGEERRLINARKCIEQFGRHNTDLQFGYDKKPSNALPRLGKDTGSSEVQIAILTGRIHNLSERFRNGYKRDIQGKRKLRLLLHRRQKMLRYMEKRERGSPRWFNMLSTLGLTPATWKGEISLSGTNPFTDRAPK